jgi:CheY-like chemotaxis protein
VILDVVMPIMGGREALKKIRQINPEIRALFTTGYTPDAAPLQTTDDLDESVQLIRKPSRKRELLRVLRSLLDN